MTSSDHPDSGIPPDISRGNARDQVAARSADPATASPASATFPVGASPQPAPPGAGKSSGDGESNIGALDGIRFLAALCIVIYHLYWRELGYGRSWLDTGYLAVDLFFVLSGALLARSYLGARPLAAGKFWWTRFTRLYPLYLLSGLMMVPLMLRHVSGQVVFVDQAGVHLLEYAIMAQAWLGTMIVNAPGWSVGDFAFCYGIFPFFGTRLKALGKAGLWWAFAVFFAVSLVTTAVGTWLMGADAVAADGYARAMADSSRTIMDIVHECPPLRAPEFLCGVVVGLALNRGAVPAILARHGLWVGAVMMAGLAWAAGSLPFLITRNALGIVPSALIIVGATARYRAVEATLGHPWLMVLGRASFPIYLLHFPVLGVIVYATRHRMSDGPVAATAYVVVVLVASVLAQRYFVAPVARVLKSPPWRKPRAE